MAWDIKDILESRNVYCENSDGEFARPVFAETMFVGREPGDVESSLTVFDASGAPATKPMDYAGSDAERYERHNVQVRIKNTDQEAAARTASEIVRVLDAYFGQVNNSLYMAVRCTLQPALLDWQEDGSSRWVVSFAIFRKPILGGDWVNGHISEVLVTPEHGVVSFPDGWDNHPGIVVHAQYQSGADVFHISSAFTPREVKRAVIAGDVFGIGADENVRIQFVEDGERYKVETIVGELVEVILMGGARGDGQGLTTEQSDKLAGIEDGAERNVQSDWNETDNQADGFIKHKPRIASTGVPEMKRTVVDVITANSRADISVRNNNVLATTGNQLLVEHDSIDGDYLNSLKVGSVVGVFNASTTSWHKITAVSGDLNLGSDSNWTRLTITPDYTRPDLETEVTLSFLEAMPADAGEANVQADWGQEDTTQSDFIKNKPPTITQDQTNKLAGIESGAERNVNADWNAAGGDAEILNKPPTITQDQTNKLAGIADGAEVNVPSDWNATTGDATILNKPTIPANSTDLADMPQSIVGDKMMTSKTDGTGYELRDIPAGGGQGQGSATWTGLTDTPGSYTGQKDKVPFVKTDETGLELRVLPLEVLENFEAALRTRERLLLSESIQVAIADAAYDARQDLLGSDDDRDIIIKTANPASEYKFKMKTLNDLAGVDQATQLTNSNALTWSSDDGNVEFFIAKGRNGHFLFSADSVGTYSVSIDHDSVDLSPWARKSNADKIPADKLPLASGSASGIIGPDEFVRLHAAIDQEHLHDTPLLTNPDLQPLDALLLDDHSVADGEGSQLKEVPVSELDKRWYVRSSRIPDSGLSRKAEDFFDATTDGGWKNEGEVATEDAWVLDPDENMLTAKPDITVASAPGVDYSWQAERGPRFTNEYDIIRVPTILVSDLSHLRYGIGDPEIVGDFHSIPSSDWESLGEQGVYTYYTVQVADKPAGSIQRIQRHAAFEIDSGKVKFYPPLSAVENVHALPSDPYDGQKIFLLSDLDVPDPAILTAGSEKDGTNREIGVGYLEASSNGGHQIGSITPTNADLAELAVFNNFAPRAAVRGKVVFTRPSGKTYVPAKVIINSVEYVLTAVSGLSNSFGTVATTYAGVMKAGTEYSVNVETATGVKMFPDKTISAGATLSWDARTHRWIRDERGKSDAEIREEAREALGFDRAWFGTQAQYNGLGTKDDKTLYFVGA